MKSRQPDVPWKQIAGMRDKVIHDYFGVNLEIVWAVVEKELPKLEHAVVLAGNWQERCAKHRLEPRQAMGRVLTFAPECVISYPVVPYRNGWSTPQNPVHLTVSVGAIPTSGTKKQES